MPMYEREVKKTEHVERPAEPRDVRPHVSIVSRKGVFWTLRKGVRTFWNMAIHSNGEVRSWRRMADSDHSDVYMLEGKRLWLEVTNPYQTLATQLERAERMELAFHLARSQMPNTKAIQCEAWAASVRLHLERQARILGPSLSRSRYSARPIVELPATPW
jgi:hypothetical protein